MNYVGMDYHKRYSVVCILDDARNIVAQQRIEHAFPERSVQLLGAHALCQEAFEASMKWGLLHEILEVIPGVGRRAMANPLYVRLIAAAQVKTDKVDARKLAQLLRAGLLPSSHIPGRATRMCKEVLRIRTFWVRECTKVCNRIHRLLGRLHGLALPHVSDLFGKKGRSALSKLALPAPTICCFANRRRCLMGWTSIFTNSTRRLRGKERTTRRRVTLGDDPVQWAYSRQRDRHGNRRH